MPHVITAHQLSLKDRLLGSLGTVLIRLIASTVRWTISGAPPNERPWPEGPARILAGWHGQQLLLPWSYLKFLTPRAKPIFALISQHGDGRIAAAAMRSLGISSIAGSSTRGGREALLALVDTIKGGDHVAITPDGPRGPIHEVKPGAIRLAQKTGAEITPVALAADRSWRFKSWDKMFLPKPFSHVGLVFGEPLAVPEILSTEQFDALREELAHRLNTATRVAEQLIGVSDREAQNAPGAAPQKVTFLRRK